MAWFFNKKERPTAGPQLYPVTCEAVISAIRAKGGDVHIDDAGFATTDVDGISVIIADSDNCVVLSVLTTADARIDDSPCDADRWVTAFNVNCIGPVMFTTTQPIDGNNVTIVHADYRILGSPFALTEEQLTAEVVFGVNAVTEAIRGYIEGFDVGQSPWD